MKKSTLSRRLSLRQAFRPALLAGLPAAVLLSLAACSSVDLDTPADAAAAGQANAAVAPRTEAAAASVPSPMPAKPLAMDDGEGAKPAAAPASVALTGRAATLPPAAPDKSDKADKGPALATDADPDSMETAPVVLPPYDPLQPDERVNLDDHNARSDLWLRVRDGFAIPDIDTPLVKEWEQWYSSRPDYVDRMTARGSRYLYHITQEVERRHMPTELALLPFTESAFNPQAMSVAKASGMWQFIASTGHDYDLKQNIFRDDRRDVLASTRAALDYLQRLHDMFGDWQLALAAYNCGEGNVQRAINRNLKAGLPTDYLSLNLPAETRAYFPKLQAVKNIVQHPGNYGLALPELGNHPYFLSVPIERDIDVEAAARLANVSIDEFKMLNPQLSKPVILAAGTPQVLLPYDNADHFVTALKSHEGPLASWTAWVAAKTLRPAEAARMVGMSEEELREVNHIPARMLVKAGSTLLVPRSAQHTSDVSLQVADSAAMTLAPDLPPTRRVNMRVGRGGESVLSVARHWHLPASEVASWNHMAVSGRFGAGTTAVLFLPRSASLARATTTTTTMHASVSRATHGKAAPVEASGVTGDTKVAGTKAPHGKTASAANKGAAKVAATASNERRKGGGASSRRTEKTKVRVAQH